MKDDNDLVAKLKEEQGKQKNEIVYVRLSKAVSDYISQFMAKHKLENRSALLREIIEKWKTDSESKEKL